MSNIVIVSFAVALFLVLLEDVISYITIFIPPKITNLLVSSSLAYLGLYLLEPLAIKVMLVYTFAASFLSRTSLAIAKRATTYRLASVKQSD